MSRMHVNKSSVFGSAGKHRPGGGSHKARERDFAVMTAPGKMIWRDVRCYTCDTFIRCDLKPIPDPASPFGAPLVPKYNAPLICGVCRKDPKKFRVARKAMLDYFGWNEEGKEGFEV